MVRVKDLQSGGPKFKSYALITWVCFMIISIFKSKVMLHLKSEHYWSALPVGIFNKINNIVLSLYSLFSDFFSVAN